MRVLDLICAQLTGAADPVGDPWGHRCVHDAFLPVLPERKLGCGDGFYAPVDVTACRDAPTDAWSPSIEPHR